MEVSCGIELVGHNFSFFISRIIKLLEMNFFFCVSQRFGEKILETIGDSLNSICILRTISILLMIIIASTYRGDEFKLSKI